MAEVKELGILELDQIKGLKFLEVIINVDYNGKPFEDVIYFGVPEDQEKDVIKIFSSLRPFSEKDTKRLHKIKCEELVETMEKSEQPESEKK